MEIFSFDQSEGGLHKLQPTEEQKQQIVSLFRFLAANNLSISDLSTLSILSQYVPVHELFRD